MIVEKKNIERFDLFFLCDLFSDIVIFSQHIGTCCKLTKAKRRLFYYFDILSVILLFVLQFSLEKSFLASIFLQTSNELMFSPQFKVYISESTSHLYSNF